MSAMFRSNTKTVRAATNTGDKRMKFNWFKRKELTPEIVLEILRADAEKATTEYVFGNKGLPVMVADDDYLEFLEEEGIAPGDSVEMVEAAELFKIWMTENCL